MIMALAREEGDAHEASQWEMPPAIPPPSCSETSRAKSLKDSTGMGLPCLTVSPAEPLIKEPQYF